MLIYIIQGFIQSTIVHIFEALSIVYLFNFISYNPIQYMTVNRTVPFPESNTENRNTITRFNALVTNQNPMNGSRFINKNLRHLS